MALDDPVPVLVTPRREARNTPARVALGFDVKDVVKDVAVGGSSDAGSPTTVVTSPLARAGSGSGEFGESLLNADELVAPKHDIRIMLKNGSSKPVEVLRSQMVTSLTLSWKAELFTKHRHVFSLSSRLVLG